MTTNLNDIQLNETDKEMLAKVAETKGKPWRDVFQDALTRYAQTHLGEEVDLLAEYRELFPGLNPEQQPVSLERIRHILSKVSGSLAADIIADREDRL